MVDPSVGARIAFGVGCPRLGEQRAGLFAVASDVCLPGFITLDAHMLVAVDAVAMDLTWEHREVVDAVAEFRRVGGRHFQPRELVPWNRRGLVDLGEGPEHALFAADHVPHESQDVAVD